MKRIAGFTLVEVAIVVLIGSMLLIAGLSMFKARLDQAQIEVTQKRQDAIKQALISYLGRNKRLPCPDNDNDGREDRNPAAPYACYVPAGGATQYFGIVPYVDLGLERSVAIDGWENYFRYVVSPNWRFTYTSGAPDNKNSAVVPTNVYNADAAYVPKVSTGVIAVYVNTTIAPVMDPCNGAINPSNNGAVVAVISHGKNGVLARNVAGNVNAGNASQDETQNSAPGTAPAFAPACAWNVFRVVRRDSTDTFDDIVVTISEAEFTAPLVASGAIYGSVDYAVSRANEFVIGNLVRTACPGTMSPACSSPNYYYSLPATINFPSEIKMFGVQYVRVVTDLDSSNPTTLTSTAYTLNASDGSVLKTVTIGELRGIIGVRLGFL